MKNADYWIAAPGQLQAGERVASGYRTAREAWEAFDRLGKGRIACLRTIESEHPIESAEYKPFESSRYCLIVTGE